ncbi:MAG: substrate-binding domain-containing protein [Ardenticatenaceae bacterium]|nr:substrate-binding domain-containing protein [Ardenticatenaceae bacterium]
MSTDGKNMRQHLSSFDDQPSYLYNARPTVGLLIDAIHSVTQQNRWLGVIDAAREANVNLVTFPGDKLGSAHDYATPANILYKLANAQNLDGLIIWTGSLDWYVTHQQLEAFCKQYAPLPIVCIETAVSDYPTIAIDNYQGMQSLVQHLIAEHHCHRFAFIHGPEGHRGVQERYRAFADTLAAHNLPLISDLLVSGDFSRKAGERAISTLLDERQASFDALVAVNDSMAVGALRALQSRGISVPADIAIVGFGDTEKGIPPITTIRPPFNEMGRQALATLLALLEKQSVPELLQLPTQPIIRQSCGCFSKHVLEVTVPTKKENATTPKPASVRQQVLKELLPAVQNIPELDEMPLLANLFFDEIFDNCHGRFLPALRKTVTHVAVTGGDVAQWHTGISLLRRQALPLLTQVDHARAEDLWQQARLLINEAQQWVQDYPLNQSGSALSPMNAVQLHHLDRALLATFKLAELTKVIMQELQRLGIERGVIALYQRPETLTDWARPILVFDENGRVPPSEHDLFPTRQLAPANFFTQAKTFNWVILPLYFHTEHFGYMLLETNLRSGLIYETLRRRLSNALNGVLLVEQVQQAQTDLAQAHAELEQRIMSRTAALEQEITERARTETALRENETTKRALLEAIPDTIFEIDKDGFYHNFIPAEGFKNVLEPNEFLGMRPEDILPPALAQQINQSVKLALATGNIQFHEYPLTIGDETRYYEARFLVSGEDRVLGIVRDITERKQSEAEREQLIAELEAKNAELERFTYTVSHDLKSPLVTIRGFLGFLQKDVELGATERINHDIQHIHNATTRMQRLLDDLLELSRVGRLINPPQWVPYAILIESAFKLVMGKASQNQVQLDIMPNLPEVFVDELRFLEVLQNLLDNAIKFMGKQAQPRIEIGAQKLDTETAFFVRDNGIGIKSQYHAKIFDLFERLDETVEGTGIGLALVKRIVEIHNGRIWVESNNDQPGVTFWFTLPNTAVSPPTELHKTPPASA